MTRSCSSPTELPINEAHEWKLSLHIAGFPSKCTLSPVSAGTSRVSAVSEHSISDTRANLDILSTSSVIHYTDSGIAKLRSKVRSSLQYSPVEKPVVIDVLLVLRSQYPRRNQLCPVYSCLERSPSKSVSSKMSSAINELQPPNSAFLHLN